MSKKLLFAEKLKKENLSNFKNPKPSMDMLCIYIFKCIGLDFTCHPITLNKTNPNNSIKNNAY